MAEDDLIATVEAAVTAAQRCTDAGNARRLARRGKDRILYAPGEGWMLWDGKRWKRDAGFLINEEAKATARAIYGEAERATDDDVREAQIGRAHV